MRMLFLFTVFCLFSLFIAGFAISKDYKVLVLMSDSSALAETAVLKSFEKIGNNTFKYTEFNIAVGGTRPVAGGKRPAEWVKNGDLKWTDYQMIWFSWNGPGHDGDYFMNDTEEDILNLVKNGAVVFMSAFDDNFRDAKGKQIGLWMPLEEHPCGVDNTGDSDVKITADGEKTTLFKEPNELNDAYLNTLTLDDNMAPGDGAYVSLANRVDNSKPAVFLLKYGKGAYVGCCYDARSTFPAATKIVENMLNYMASLTTSAAVEPEMKLQSLWGKIKESH